MGLKHEARTSATEAGVPVLPGGELVPTLAEALASATQVGYPVRLRKSAKVGTVQLTAFALQVMLKATGGGGGMGMVVCEDADELETSYESTVKMTKVSPYQSLSPCFFFNLSPVPLFQRWSLHREVYSSSKAYRGASSLILRRATLTPDCGRSKYSATEKGTSSTWGNARYAVQIHLRELADPSESTVQRAATPPESPRGSS